MNTGWFSNLSCAKNVFGVYVWIRLYVCFADVDSFRAKEVAKVQSIPRDSSLQNKDVVKRINTGTLFCKV